MADNNERKNRVLGLSSLNQAFEYLNNSNRMSDDEDGSKERPQHYQHQLGDISEGRIHKQLVTYLKKENLDSNSNFTWNRKTLSDFMVKTYGIKLS